MSSLLEKINAYATTNNAGVKTTTQVEPKAVVVEPKKASNRQRRAVYYAALKFGVKFTGIWEGNINADELAPVVKVLHKSSTYDDAKKKAAVVYAAEELRIKHEMVNKYTAPSEPVIVETEDVATEEPKAKPKKQRDLTPLEYARYKKACTKANVEPVNYEQFKADKAKALVKLSATKVKDKVEAKVEPTRKDVVKAAKAEAVQSKTEFNDAQKLSMVMDHLKAQVEMCSYPRPL
jgi:hypothetical protein